MPGQDQVDRRRAGTLQKALLVCEDALLLDRMVAQLAEEACRLSVARSGISGIEMMCRAMVGKDPFDVVIAQFDLPVLSGLEVLRRVRLLSQGTQTVLLTSAACHKNLGHRFEWVDRILIDGS